MRAVVTRVSSASVKIGGKCGKNRQGGFSSCWGFPKDDTGGGSKKSLDKVTKACF